MDPRMSAQPVILSSCVSGLAASNNKYATISIITHTVINMRHATYTNINDDVSLSTLNDDDGWWCMGVNMNNLMNTE